MKLHKHEEGSITLEAAVFMPVFILFLVFLIFMIQFSLTDIALNQAVRETAKQISTQAYPVDKVAKGVGEVINNNENVQELKNDIEEIKADIDATIGEGGFDELIVEPAKGAGRFILTEAAKSGLTLIVQNHLGLADQLGFIELDNVEVTEVDLARDNKFIEIVVEYEIDLPIPFITRTFKMQKKAYERLWIGS